LIINKLKPIMSPFFILALHLFMNKKYGKLQFLGKSHG
jgi:hypothetical protein